MRKHSTIPCLAADSKSSADTKTLVWDGEKYTLTIKDNNGVLADFTFISSSNNVKISQSGNTLTITSGKVIANEVTLTGTKKIPTVSTSAKLVAYGGTALLQDIITGVTNVDKVNAYLNVKIPRQEINWILVGCVVGGFSGYDGWDLLTIY